MLGITMNWLESVIPTRSYISGGIIFYPLLVAFVTLIVTHLVKRQRKIWMINKIPGPKPLPIVGNALEVNVDSKGIFETVTHKFPDNNKTGGIVRMWLIWNPYVLIYKANTCEVILSSQKHIDKSFDYNFLHSWLGTGLLTSTGRKWHQRRRILTPAFHFKILEDFVEVFSQQGLKLAQKLENHSDGNTFDIFPYITLCTLDIILETAMGVSISAQDKPESDYVKSVYKIGNIVQIRQTRPWLQPNILFKLSGYERKERQCLDVLHGFSNKMIKERREEWNEKKKQGAKKEEEKDDVIGRRKRLAFLDLLLDSTTAEGTSLSNEDIREEVDTFMFEGHDTTAAAINWTVYLLATHPKIQKEVQEELDSIFADDKDRSITMDDIRNMKLLECCIKEALRLFPSVPFLARELKEEIVIDGYTIPVGTTAMIVTYRLHRDPEQFPDPEEFKPDRFLPENSSGRHAYAYVPFSAGPRNCIGQKFALMEEKTVVASVLRKYRVESKVKREELKLTGELILRPEDGNFIQIFKR